MISENSEEFSAKVWYNYNNIGNTGHVHGRV